MDILDRFEFSQSSLQDYVDCRRRFQLRYIERVAWPAVQAEPVKANERHIQRGERFHRLAQQYLLGVPAERLARFAESDPDENLQRWWQNYLEYIPAALQGRRYVEIGLEVPLDGVKIFARYDLVMINPDGQVVIYDWKTSTKRPRRETLLARLQTRIYPFVLVQAGAAINGGNPIAPDQVQMVYWFAEPGLAAERMPYSREQYLADQQYVRALINEVRGLHKDEFGMSASETACRYCVYRSLCSRGAAAGELPEDEDLEAPGVSGLDFDLEQIGEISF